MRIVDLNENTKKDLLGELLKRNPGQYKEYEDSVAKIIADVRDNGDKALFGYTLKYDGAVINADNLRVTQSMRRTRRWMKNLCACCERQSKILNPTTCSRKETVGLM